eukprot:TRINITY_DN7109_c0_g4_i2.p1 TRINITY_DN7109_c0_g4~~TRINITY_DN7109_c0_g4_i2.p1  ORF type:complete len:566 (+),score=199.23 TRINITY_DN7109_c0_g4_i2:252-1949(+)
MRTEQKNLEELSIKVRELENDMKARARQAEVQWTEHVKELELDKKRALGELELRVNSLKEELSKKEQQHTEAIKKLEGSHIASVTDLEAIFKAKVDRERKNYLNLEQNMKETVHTLKVELDRKEKEKDKELLDEHLRYEKDLKKLNRKIKDVKDSQLKAEQRFEDKLTLQEEEHSEEMDRREIDLNKEINNLKNTVKNKEDAYNRLDTQFKELQSRNLELVHSRKILSEEIETLQRQKKAFQSEAEKAHKDMVTSIEEINELKGKIITLKSKNKDGLKDRQALAELAKSLREKMSPVIEENNDLKAKIQGIENEYNMNIKIVEKMKETILNQETAVVQQREDNKKRVSVVKRCEERIEQIAHKLYQFKERQNFDKNSYATLFRELYTEYVDKEEAKFRKNPEIVGELGRQIQHLQEKKTSLEKNSKLKNEQLSKLCTSLRRENAKLIDDLNDTRKRLQEVTMQKLSYEGKLRSVGLLNTKIEQLHTERIGSPDLTGRSTNKEPKKATPRPFTSKQRNTPITPSGWQADQRLDAAAPALQSDGKREDRRAHCTPRLLVEQAARGER